VLGIHRKLGNRQVIGITLVNMGSLHADRHESERAKAYYLEAVDLLDPSGDVQGLAMLYGNLALVVREEGDLPSAVGYFETAVRQLRRLGDSAELARTINSLGKTRLMQGRPEEALGRCEEALAMSQRLNDDLGMAAAWYNLVAIHEGMGRLDEAISFLTWVVEVDERYALPKLEENRERLKQLMQIREGGRHVRS
jgi:tetratricopeptide (TPR) repeat protein